VDVSEESADSDLKWPLRVRRERRDGVLVLAMAGRVGRASADTLRQALEEAIDQGERRLVVDFGSVDYLSSSGLMVLAAASSRLDILGGTLVLCGLVEPVQVVLNLSALLPHFAIEPSRDRAIARLADRLGDNTSVRP
jgi:anti-anti-sigma factor